MPLHFEENGKRIFIGERDVSTLIRAPHMGEATSRIAAIGAVRPAIVVNGSIPAPLLRWREGTTVNLRVSNALPPNSIHGHQTSIHWHGILLPANMDGVPGLSFDGIQRGETYQRVGRDSCKNGPKVS